MLTRFNARRRVTSLIATVSFLAVVLTATPSVASAAVKSHSALPQKYTIVDQTNPDQWLYGDFIYFDVSQFPSSAFEPVVNWYDCTTTAVDDLEIIQRSLNGRPRKTLGYMMPQEKLTELIALST